MTDYTRGMTPVVLPMLYVTTRPLRMRADLSALAPDLPNPMRLVLGGTPVTVDKARADADGRVLVTTDGGFSAHVSWGSLLPLDRDEIVAHLAAHPSPRGVA